MAINDTHTVGSVLLGFVPTLRVPPSSVPSISIACACITAAIYSLTYPSSASSYLRLFLSVPALYYLIDFGYGPYICPARSVELGVCVVALFGVMRVIDVCFITAFLDTREKRAPRWVTNGSIQPLPTTVRGRLAYSLDLLLTVRGMSMFPNTYWDFASKRVIRASTSMKGVQPRSFIRQQCISILVQYMVWDALDSINKSRKWDTTVLHPVTSLPIFEQLVFAVSVCAGTALAISIPFAMLSIIGVSLGCEPASWPPMIDSPFSAISLTDFWTHRWHSLFRHTFDRLSFAIIHLIPSRLINTNTRNAIRAIVIFSLSATLHLLLMYRLETSLAFVHPSFFDRSTLQFFLSQPLAVLMELIFIVPLSHRFFPNSISSRVRMTRIWAWAWLLCSGRWWSDTWIRRGLFAEQEKVVGLSLVRGLWKGEWIV